jgi:thiol-disulfide isomerase/thioredoxin
MSFILKNFWAIVLCLAVAPLANAAVLHEALPSCALKTFSGDKSLDLSQYKGKVVYLDFWASWCPSCISSFPFMSQMQTELKSQGLEIIAVNLDENRADGEAFLKSTAYSFEVAVTTDSTCPERFNVVGMPTSYLVDKKGIIREIHTGFRAGDEVALKTAVLALLKE